MVLFDLNGDKAPGLDSFTAVFWEENWDTIKGEILNLFRREFHKKGRSVGA